MNDTLENRIIKGSTGSGAIADSRAITLVAASLIATLSGAPVCYGFEENPAAQGSNYHGKNLNISAFDENVERIVQYASDNYNQSFTSQSELNIKNDLRFLELSHLLAESQVDIDPEIQDALNQFSKIMGAKPPRKNRF